MPQVSKFPALYGEIPGFAWAVPYFFQEAISSYQFTHGDTVYQTIAGYRAGFYEGQRIMVRTTATQRRIDQAQRLSQIPNDHEAQSTKRDNEKQRLHLSEDL